MSTKKKAKRSTFNQRDGLNSSLRVQERKKRIYNQVVS